MLEALNVVDTSQIGVKKGNMRWFELVKLNFTGAWLRGSKINQHW
jgi:hypothetical protein